MKRSVTVVARATSRCNTACDYCYAMAERKSVRDFAFADVETFIQNVSQGFDTVRFVWHGGEPLMVGMDFYRKVVAVQERVRKKHGTEFNNKVQSNGLLLNEEWMEFFSTNCFGVGVSLDAPEDAQFAHRGVDAEKVLKKTELVRKYQGSVGALCVVSDLNVGRPEEVFLFFASHGFDSYGILPMRKINARSKLRSPDADEMSLFYQRTFDRWLKQESPVRSIEPLTTMIEGLTGGRPELCSFNSSCLKRMVAVTQDGEVIPCSSLEKPEFVIGNIFDKSLAEILSCGKTAKLRWARAEAVREWCRGCEYISICRGGCRSDSYWSTGSYKGGDPLCGAKRQTFDYLRRRLRERVNLLVGTNVS